jgi:hypothetical protein
MGRSVAQNPHNPVAPDAVLGEFDAYWIDISRATDSSTTPAPLRHERRSERICIKAQF